MLPMLKDIRGAFSFLTIMPVGTAFGGIAGAAFAWFPLVGLCIGALLVAVAHHSPFHRDLTAFFILLAWVIVTGGLHLDGFGDSCDGLCASAAPEKRNHIMRDPRLGAWGAIGLVLLLLGKWLALRSVSPEWLPLAPVFGRWAMVWAAYHFPTARDDGLAARFRDGLSTRGLLIASAWVVILLTRAEIAALWLLIYGFTTLFGGWAARRLGGGLSGDVYGAICELSELICLLYLGCVYG
ncbi:MAG: adenosylcobinamide-GDP ribazoletransferase [Chloroflexota bacterium]|nr:adenosylcobinamide-GDP ribazoletransferase [Chloroflexota bacterium]